MEILKDNYTNKSAECESCKSLLYVNEDDFQFDEDGYGYWKCPLCGCENYIPGLMADEPHGIFPSTFYHFGDGVRVEDDEINKWIKQSVEYLRKNPDEPYYRNASGDSFAVVFNNYEDNEYDIIVARGYYEDEVPYSEAMRLQK